MLLPVSAVSAADVSPHSNGPKPENQSVSSAPVPASPTETEAHVNSASTTVRAVSGQVQLAQNSTVLAETLGKLLNIARMENETAGAYATRLVIAMQALPANQKAMLEQVLSKLLKGLTIGILSDALKNSAGPDTARLAVVFELARSTQPSGTARTLRSSYLQDALLRDPLLNPIKTVLPMPASEDEARSQTTQTGQRLPGKNDLLPAGSAEGQHGRTNSSPPSTSQTDPALKKSGNPERPPIHVGDNSSGQEALPVKPLPVSASGNEDSVEARTTDRQVGTVQSVTSNASQADAEENLQTPKPTLAITQFQDLRLTPFEMKQQFSGATAKDSETLLLAVLLGKLPPDADTDQATSSTLFQPKGKVQAEPKQPSGASPAFTPRSTETVENDVPTQMRAETLGAHKSAAAADLKTILLEQPALQSAVAGMITKDGTPLPFVNYPAEKDEAKSDSPPRGRWPSSSDGDPSPDEEHSSQQNQEQPEREERLAANDEALDQSVSDGANEDGRVGDAESYYLRMSSFV